MSVILAIVNQKGGVGKTTTTINLAAALALENLSILAIDLDSQANLTSGLGRRGQKGPAGTVYDALTSTSSSSPLDFTLPTAVPGLALVAADRALIGAELELAALEAREGCLRRFLQPLAPSFDFILIDAPPSLGLLTLNALVAADSVLIPLSCEYFALEGLAELVSTLRQVRVTVNPRLDIEGVLLTMYDERTNLGQQVAREVRDFFGGKVFQTVIPRNVRLGEAPSHGMPVALYDPRSRGAEAYRLLARELLTRRAVTPSVTLDSLAGSKGPTRSAESAAGGGYAKP